MPHVFVQDLQALELDDADRHHLERVLRLRAGDRVTAADDRGGWRDARWAGGTLEADGDVVIVPPAEPVLTVAFALTKGERPELAVQKLTEVGVDRIIPFVAERSVARWEGERASRHVERLRRVGREAAMQCERAYLPVVDDVTTFDVVVALPDAALAERHGAPPSLAHATLVVGPEGGWSPGEAECGLPRVVLGPQVLRAETAALAAGVLLTALRAGIVGPSGPL